MDAVFDMLATCEGSGIGVGAFETSPFIGVCELFAHRDTLGEALVSGVVEGFGGHHPVI
jgi:hypothetical protein